MITDKIDLYRYFGVERKDANGGYLTVCARTESNEVKRRTRPAMLVVPGGGYGSVSDREGEPVALKFVDKGYVAFVLSYSIHIKYPTPLYEAEMAVAFIRDNAQKYNVDASHVCAVGFSAGGHLTGMLATVKSDETICGRTAEQVRPDAVILSYPVVTLGEKTHGGSCNVITGGDKSLIDKLSVEKRADKDSSPAFIWHTYEDQAVPVENSLMLASAYVSNKVPCALHIFEKGWHGLSIADDEVCSFPSESAHLSRVGKWIELACDWLEPRGFVRGE